MEALVLCPEELCLGPVRLSPLLGISPPPAELSIWTNETLEKGTRFLPWKGTVRSDKLPVFEKLPEFDVRNRFGLYDEISEVSPGRKVRQCNWIRFLRYSLVYNDSVNIVGAKGPTGEPVFELVKDLTPKSELVCFFVPERPEEAFLLPAIQYLRHTLFKRLIDNVLEESPLDLSTSLVSKVFPISPTNSDASSANLSSNGSGGRKSVSSDCPNNEVIANSTGMENFLSKGLNPFQHAAAQMAAAAAAAASMAASSSTNNNNNHLERLSSNPSPPTSNPSPPPAITKPSSPPHALSVEALTSKTPIKTSPSTPGRPPTQRRREKNMLPCNYCGKAFDRPSLLKRHIRIHTGERPHVCDICKKGFSTSSSLNTHRRIHSGEKPHQCGVCGKRFTASSNLYYHKMTHVKEKPHKCTMCSKSFPTPGDLKSHTYVHTGTWPFKCHICHRGFSKQTNLKNHLLLHSGDKPFSCDICHKKFALSCNLRAHLKTHEAEYQNSQASLALYQRALAVLGGASSSQTSPTASASSNHEDEDEENNAAAAADRESNRAKSTSPELNNAQSPSLEFSKQLTVAV